MSADLLRKRFREDAEKVISEHSELLVTNAWSDLGQMRHQQGIVVGLKIAIDLLDERAKNLHAIG